MAGMTDISAPNGTKAFQLFSSAEFGLLVSTHKLELPVVEDPGPWSVARTRKACTDDASRPASASRFSSAHLCLKATADLHEELHAESTIERARVARNPYNRRHPRPGQNRAYNSQIQVRNEFAARVAAECQTLQNINLVRDTL